jgi:hypothetical protein
MLSTTMQLGPSPASVAPARPTDRSLRTFLMVMRVVSAAPLLIGAFHIIHGPAADAALGANMPPEVLADAVLDSQSRFYGAIFMGYGAFSYISLTALAHHAATFRVVGGFLVLGGLARLLSLVLRGYPGPSIAALIAVELGLVPLILWWHSRVLAHLRSTHGR